MARSRRTTLMLWSIAVALLLIVVTPKGCQTECAGGCSTRCSSLIGLEVPPVVPGVVFASLAGALVIYVFRRR